MVYRDFSQKGEYAHFGSVQQSGAVGWCQCLGFAEHWQVCVTPKTGGHAVAQCFVDCHLPVAEGLFVGNAVLIEVCRRIAHYQYVVGCAQLGGHGKPDRVLSDSSSFQCLYIFVLPSWPKTPIVTRSTGIWALKWMCTSKELIDFSLIIAAFIETVGGIIHNADMFVLYWCLYVFCVCGSPSLLHFLLHLTLWTESISAHVLSQ